MIMQQRLIDLIDQSETIYTGTPWFGPSWLETLERIPATAFSFHLEKGPSIAGLLLHVLAWRKYVIQKLQGEDEYELNPDQDWPDATGINWEVLIREFADSQQELLEALSDFEASMLDDIVPGRGYTWGFMIQGLINHDVYHMAQVNLLAKQLIETP